MTNRNLYISIFLSAVLVLYSQTFADTYQKPLEVRNLHILYLPYLFLPLENSKTIEHHEYDFRLNFYKASTYYDPLFFPSPKKTGVFDVETTLVNFTWSMKMTDGLELRLALPYIYHGSGYLDPIIENFHHLFPYPEEGLPNGGRDYAPSSRFLIYYNGGQGSVYYNQAIMGFGDPSLFLKKQLLREKIGISLLCGLKIPLGNKPFIHSKTFDAGMSLNADIQHRWFYAFGMIGGVYLFGRSYLEEEFSKEQHHMIYWGYGIGILPSDRLALLMQVYYQSSPYRTGVMRIDRASILHSFGIRWQWLDSVTLQFSADEDTFNYATSDIALQMQIEYRY